MEKIVRLRKVSKSYSNRRHCDISSRRIFLKEKCPTLTVTLFILQTTELTLIGPLFIETTETTEAKAGQLQLSAKGPPFHF